MILKSRDCVLKYEKATHLNTISISAVFEKGLNIEYNPLGEWWRAHLILPDTRILTSSAVDYIAPLDVVKMILNRTNKNTRTI